MQRWWVRLILSVALVAVLSGAGIWWAITHRPDQNDMATVRREVARHMILPTDEDPVLATITDKQKLSYPFLRQANNDDKVLIYAKAHRIILYRPSVDRIVDVGPIEISNTGQ